MKIPFSIEHREKIESGEYKVFAHEHEEQEARIVCWDNKGEYPIVALVDNEPEKFDKYGRVPGGNRGGEFSLFIITPETELTEFEDRVKQLMGCYPNATRENKGSLIYEVRKATAELLELARKELSRQGNIVLTVEEFEKRHMEAQEIGRKEALKDLPRWNTVEKVGNIITKEPYIITNMIGEKKLYIGLKSISIHSLEKLPGFKEGK